MCGITGFVDFNKKQTLSTLQIMTDTLSHRGPDDCGYQIVSLDEAKVGLGHRRLSVLDLSEHGHQPMSYKGNKIVYNGEIYNFKEIKAELLTLGYTFDSTSDTEIILKSYDAWGMEALKKFNGMFAFTIFDENKKTLILARDRTGIKPLFYYEKDGLFLFSSELKSFHQCKDFDKTIDSSALAQFFNYGYIPQPYCIYKNIAKIKSGHYLEYDLQKKTTKVSCYWDVIDCYNQPKLDISYSEAKDKLEELLTSAFSYRLLSDVPVGVFLSGGYDSSAVAAILQKNSKTKIKTYSIGFHEEKYNEANHAKIVAAHIGTDHTEYYCTQKEALEILRTLPEIYDEPFGDSSAIPTILVSKLAKQDVTVALSADGADEIFGGYGKYSTTLKYHSIFSKVPSFIRPLLAYLVLSVNPLKIPFIKNMYNISDRFKKVAEIINSKDPVSTMKLTCQIFSVDETDKLIINSHGAGLTAFDQSHHIMETNDQLGKLLAIDYKTYLVDDILSKVDRATMSVSLEGRDPFLDYRIIEYVARLPSKYKMVKGSSKIILKDLVHRFIPREMMDRPKMGFGLPVSEWFRGDFKTYLNHYITVEKLVEAGITPEIPIRLKVECLSGEDANANKLWLILTYLMWFEKWMGSSGSPIKPEH